jgi:hypothetical protein
MDWDRHGRDQKVVRFAHAISASHH